MDGQTPRKAKDKEEDEEGSERGSIDGGKEGEGGKDEAGEEVDDEVLSHRGQVERRVARGNSCQQPPCNLVGSRCRSGNSHLQGRRRPPFASRADSGWTGLAQPANPKVQTLDLKPRIL